VNLDEKPKGWAARRIAAIGANIVDGVSKIELDTMAGLNGITRNLTDPTWIKVKGALFLFLGIFSGALLLLEHPTLRTGFLLGIAVWGFCRFYYFAFYVIEHYVDPDYRFSGLFSFARYWLFAKHASSKSHESETNS
jgi:hypothetical protein